MNVPLVSLPNQSEVYGGNLIGSVSDWFAQPAIPSGERSAQSIVHTLFSFVRLHHELDEVQVSICLLFQSVLFINQTSESWPRNTIYHIIVRYKKKAKPDWKFALYYNILPKESMAPSGWRGRQIDLFRLSTFDLRVCQYDISICLLLVKTRRRTQKRFFCNRKRLCRWCVKLNLCTWPYSCVTRNKQWSFIPIAIKHRF